MKSIFSKLIINLIVVTGFIANGYAITVVNYHNDSIRLELEDCKTYNSYGSFPSNFKWSFLKGDLASKAKYLYVDTLQTGYYSINNGTNIPKKLCYNILNTKTKQSFKGKISTYQTCTISVIDNESGDGIKLDVSYDCHQQAVD